MHMNQHGGRRGGTEGGELELQQEPRKEHLAQRDPCLELATRAALSKKGNKRDPVRMSGKYKISVPFSRRPETTLYFFLLIRFLDGHGQHIKDFLRRT